MEQPERRRAVRVPVSEDVVMTRANGTAITVRCENLSCGGLALLAPARLYQSEAITVEARFLNHAAHPPLRLHGRVNYVIGLSYPPGMHRIGIEFTGLSGDEQAAVDLFLCAAAREAKAVGSA